MLWEVWRIYYFIRILFGKEIIEMRHDFIILRSQIPGLTSVRKYPTNLIRDLRVLPIPIYPNYRAWPRSEI
jgi:hypothetical protein